ncbi:MAG TPA: phage baseplate assembly protein V [Thermoanaerobaculia bacterium]|nr:phage baseplate assembly protein V [Thermoanaerobaculia bacterium]
MTAVSLEEIVARLVERVEARYYGKYRGQVTDNEDPDDLGRVKAKVPALLGDEELGWALPAFAYGGTAEQGFFAVPDVDAGVWIEFEGGHLSHPIWTGTWYPSGAIPESAKATKKVLKTTAGHKIVFDDDGESLEITDSSGNTIKMDSAGIEIADANGHTIKMTSSSVTINGGALEVM